MGLRGIETLIGGNVLYQIVAAIGLAALFVHDASPGRSAQEPPVTMTLTVSDLATSAPIAAARVVIRDGNGNEIARGTTNADGNFSWRAAIGQSLQIEYEKITYVRRPERVLATASAASTSVAGNLLKGDGTRDYYKKAAAQIDNTATAAGPDARAALYQDEWNRIEQLGPEQRSAFARSLSLTGQAALTSSESFRLASATKPYEYLGKATASNRSEITVVGCLEAGDGSAFAGTSGTSGATATGSTGASAREWVLTDPRLSYTGSTGSASSTGTSSSSGSTTGTSSAGAASPAFILDSDNGDLSAHAGHAIEVTGTLERSAAGLVATTPRINVRSVRTISSSCRDE
jgi:hypothetical protein